MATLVSPRVSPAWLTSGRAAGGPELIWRQAGSAGLAPGWLARRPTGRKVLRLGRDRQMSAASVLPTPCGAPTKSRPDTEPEGGDSRRPNKPPPGQHWRPKCARRLGGGRRRSAKRESIPNECKKDSPKKYEEATAKSLHKSRFSPAYSPRPSLELKTSSQTPTSHAGGAAPDQINSFHPTALLLRAPALRPKFKEFN